MRELGRAEAEALDGVHQVAHARARHDDGGARREVDDRARGAGHREERTLHAAAAVPAVHARDAEDEGLGGLQLHVGWGSA